MNVRIVIPLLCLLATLACQQPGGESATANEVDLQAGRAKLAAEWQAEYDKMAGAVPLSPAEQQALQSAYQDMQTELTAWIEGEKGQRLIELESEMAKAARSKDLAGVKSATSQAAPLREEFRAEIATHRQNLLNAMSPENRARWEGHRIAAHMLELMAPLNLSPDQIAAIENSAGPALQQAKGRGEPNPPAAAFLELEKWVEANVLTPEQRAAYEAVKADHPMRSLSL